MAVTMMTYTEVWNIAFKTSRPQHKILKSSNLNIKSAYSMKQI